MSAYWAGILGILCINIIFAYSIYITAAAGQLNLGGAGFMAIGAYTAGYVNTELGFPLWISITSAAIVTAFISFLIAFPILRTRGVYMILATFAFAEVVAGIILNIDAVGGPIGMSVIDYADLSIMIPITIGVTVFVIYMMSSRIGLIMRAIHDDEQVAMLFGANIRMIQVLCYIIGGVLAGLAGALYAHQYNYIEIQYFNVLLSIYVLLYVLIGGTQTPYGPLFGAAFFTIIPEVLRINEEWRFMIFGCFLVLFMVFRPEGAVTRSQVEFIKRYISKLFLNNKTNYKN
ncbi:branched-chain amino acid ABC transporter permease [Alphaproteobacteria bacterium]|nr:branched-chain amino acid ABC transporter permease [Alphaproteobacteria bacterium]